MKSLENFRTLVEEEKSDYSKFDMLVRAGLANKAQLQRIHRILEKMKEDRPVFNNADRMILQNLFNKMVDLISNNKQIFQQTRRAVREDVELDEAELDTADYKLGPSGRKVRAHRIKVGDEVKEEFEIEESTEDIPKDPPFVLLLKRKAIRMYPNKTKVALYYNQKLDKYFTIPYGKGVDSPLQAEEVEQIEEAVMDQLHKIVAGKQAQTVKFGNGQTKKVDHYTASAITQVHKAVNDENKKKLSDMVHKSPEHLAKVASFAFSKAK
jgi:hypothetical protein